MKNKLIIYIKYLLRISVLFSFSLLLGYLSYVITIYYVSKLFFRNSYISKINTPTNSNLLVKKILEDFNALEDGKIINFEPIINGRPIEILEWEKDTDLLLGEAEPKIESCKIYLRPNLNYDILRETLLHEYLHCMGYLHVLYDKNDLMYPRLTAVGNKEKNIKDYAKSLRNKYGK
jgi:hypothetical protein